MTCVGRSVLKGEPPTVTDPRRNVPVGYEQLLSWREYITGLPWHSRDRNNVWSWIFSFSWGSALEGDQVHFWQLWKWVSLLHSLTERRQSRPGQGEDKGAEHWGLLGLPSFALVHSPSRYGFHPLTKIEGKKQTKQLKSVFTKTFRALKLDSSGSTLDDLAQISCCI